MMKILIAYAGKTGTCAECARRLCKLLPEAEAFDLTSAQPDPALYDAIVLGASVRMGRVNARAQRFAKENQPMLEGKPLAIYLCSCDVRRESVQGYFSKSELNLLSQKAVYADSLGGELDPNKQKGFDKLVVRMIQKSEKGGMTVPGILQERVEALAKAISQNETEA